MTLAEAIVNVDAAIGTGCHDSGCRFAKPTGMHTNGAHCRCLDKPGAMRAVVALIDAARREVAEDAATVASLDAAEAEDAKARARLAARLAGEDAT